jgi:sugar phosphate permease
MLITIVLVCIYQSFNSAIISLVIEGYGIPNYAVGYIFALPCLTYTFSTAIVSLFIRKVPRKLFFLCSFILATISLLIMGPSKLLGLP